MLGSTPAERKKPVVLTVSDVQKVDSWRIMPLENGSSSASPKSANAVVLKGRCLALCLHLRGIIQEGHRSVQSVSTTTLSDAGNFTTKCTVGIMLHGTRVENTLIGGPAYGRLAKGDNIIKIDGRPVSEENILRSLRGSDVPGSKVIVTVLRRRTDAPSLSKALTTKDLYSSYDFSIDDADVDQVEVTVTRMLTAEIADRRRMFDLFTFLEARAVANEDPESVMKVNETIELWTKMWLADTDHMNKIRGDVENMQSSAEACVAELIDCIDGLLKLLYSQADHFLTEARSLATQTRFAAQGQSKIIRANLDQVHAQVDSLEVRCNQFQHQIKVLQDTKRDLLGQIDQMVPKAELSAAVADATARANQSQELSHKLSSHRETINELNEKLREAQKENERLVNAMQGMVSRSDLLNAQSEAKANKEEAQAKANDVAWLEGQLGRTQEQLKAARSESAQHQLAMNDMVPRADFLAAISDAKASKDESQARSNDIASLEGQLGRVQEQLKTARAEAAQLQLAVADMAPKAELAAAKARWEDAEAQAKAASEKHRRALEELNEILRAREDENARLQSTIQGMVPRGNLLSARGEVAAITELLHELRAQTKLWVAQTKISVKGEGQILLAKVEAVNRSIASVEGQAAGLHRQIKDLQDGRRELLSQIEQMVPRSELGAARTEAAKLTKALEELHERLSASQTENSNLLATMQGMVPRVELLSAISEARASKDETSTRESAIAALEGQLSRTQEQLKAARAETAQLQDTVSREMVNKSELVAAKARLDDAEAQAKAANEKHRKALEEVNQSLRAMEDEKIKLQTEMQGMVPRAEMLSARKEASDLMQMLTDLKSKAKLWATQTRIIAQGETKVLLSMLESVASELSRLEAEGQDLRKHIKSLQDGKRNIQGALTEAITKQKANIVQSVLRRMAASSIATVWGAWVGHSAKARKLKQAAGKIVRRMQRLPVASALQAWRANASFGNRLKGAQCKVLLRLKNALLCSALNTWKETAAASSKMKRVAAKVLLRLRNASCFRTLATWAENAKETSRAKRVVGKIVFRMKNRAVSSVLLTWQANATELSRMREVAGKVLLRMQTGSIARAWAAWASNAAEGGRLRRVGARVISRFQNRTVAGALDTWRNNASESRRQRDVCERVLKRMQNIGAHRALLSWATHAAESRRAKLVCSKVIRRMQNSAAASALLRWRESAGQEKKARDVTSRVLLRMMHAGLAQALATWQAAAVESRRLRHTTGRVVRIMRNTALASAFNTWRENTGETSRARDVTEKLLRRMRNAGVAKAFAGWATKVQASRGPKQVILRVLRRMQGRLAGAALETWCANAREASRVRDVIGRVVRRMRDGCVQAAWAAWAANAGELRRQRLVCGRVIHLMQSRHLAAALHGWHANAAESRRLQAVGRRVLLRLQGACLFTALQTWAERAGEAQRMRHVGGKVILRMRSRLLAVALEAWQAAALDDRRLQAVTARVLSRLKNLTLSRSCGSWRLLVLEGRRLRLAARKTTKVLDERLVAWAMCAWRADAHADQARVGRAGILTRRAGGVEPLLQRMLRRLAVSALGRWILHVYSVRARIADAHANRRRLLGLLAPGQRRLGAAAVARWRAAAAAARHHRRVTWKSALRSKGMTQGAAFLRWRAAAGRLRLLRVSAGRFMAGSQARATRAALEAWRGSAGGGRRLRDAAARVVMRGQYWRLATALAAWRENAAESRQTQSGIVSQRVISC